MSTHPLFVPGEPLSVASLHAATDRIAVADLDEDWAVPCQHSRHEGDDPAEWVAWTTKCCGRLRKYMLLCSPCLHSSLERMATYDRWCPFCAHLFSPAATIVRLIEPLNRRTT